MAETVAKATVMATSRIIALAFLRDLRAFCVVPVFPFLTCV
jgi:hypothetical protein